MPPRKKVKKEDVVRTAVEIVRQQGEGALNARSVAKALQCSTQPVFSNFPTMELLRAAVVTDAEGLFQQALERELAEGRYPPYKASGMAYIRFAREQPQLFQLLYMRDRRQETIPEETELGEQMEGMVHGNTGLDSPHAKLFHLEMWAYVHGIAAMMATGYLELEWELVSQMLTDAYEGLKKRFDLEG